MRKFRLQSMYVCIKLTHAGEFGVVYRGKLTYWQGRTKAELVAVKTLKSK